MITTPSRLLVRRTGTGTLPGGRRVTWTVADGRRGRRWRAATTGTDGRLVHGLLLECAADGRLAKVEMTSAAGLLSLHPEPDAAMLHGNCARDGGVDHVALPWTGRHVLLFDTSPVTAAVALRALEDVIGVGEGAAVPAIEVAEDLWVRPATWRVARVGDRRWWLLAADGGTRMLVRLDEDGLPILEDAGTWPMEQDQA